jgi:Zn-dependent peptidase ImmA (M78 family)
MNIADCLDVVRRHTDQLPVDVNAIAREMGIEVVFEEMDDNISGAIACIDGGENYKILVNWRHPNTRQRFTIAHELGHYIYHRDLLGKGTGDTRAYRAEGTPFPNEHITWVQERQANNFAANTLMPVPLIRRFREMGLASPSVLAPIFVVSPQAMEIRLNTVD